MLDLFKKKNKFKTMNNRMAKNTNLATVESKKQNHGCRARFDGCQTGGWWGTGEEVRGLRSTNR